METESSKTISATISLFVHPFVSEPGVQRQSSSSSALRQHQFSQAASRILSRVRRNDLAQQQPADARMDKCHEQNAETDELTLPLPGEMPPCSTALEGYVYDNDDSFETANVDFTQESIPFRPPRDPINEDHTMADAPAVPTREEAIEAKRKEWLTSLPEGVRPHKPELVGFGAGPDASDSALTSYFYGKSKIDLVNILSLCDQLEPQLLVDILVSVSKRHPGLPIFDAPDWEERTRKEDAARAAAFAAAQARAKTHQRPRHGHTLLNPRMRQRRKGVRKIVKVTTLAEPAGKTLLVQEEETEEDEDLLPPTWRKAGEGLYSQLKSEDKDRLYLADGGDDEAFSHFMVDSLGGLTIIAACG